MEAGGGSFGLAETGVDTNGVLNQSGTVYGCVNLLWRQYGTYTDNVDPSQRVLFAPSLTIELTSHPHREWLWAHGIIPCLAKRGEAHGSGLGAYRYVVERTFAWFKGFRRLRLRYERTAFMHEAVLSVAVCIVCFRHL